MILKKRKLKIGYDPKLYTQKTLNNLFKKTKCILIPNRQNLIDLIKNKKIKDNSNKFYVLPKKVVGKDHKSKIKILPYGITCPKKNIINKRYKNDEFKLIFVGRPTLSKGIQYVIQILEQIDFPWKLEIAGSLPENPAEISEKLNPHNWSLFDSISQEAINVVL